MNRQGMLDKVVLMRNTEDCRRQTYYKKTRDLEQEIKDTSKYKIGQIVLIGSDPLKIEEITVDVFRGKLEYKCNWLELNEGFLEKSCTYSSFREEEIRETTMEEIMEKFNNESK